MAVALVLFRHKMAHYEPTRLDENGEALKYNGQLRVSCGVSFDQ